MPLLTRRLGSRGIPMGSPARPTSPAPVTISPPVKTPAFDAMAELAKKKAITPIRSGSDANIPYMPRPGAPTLVPDVKSGASIEIGPDGMPKMIKDTPYKFGGDKTAYKKGGKVAYKSGGSTKSSSSSKASSRGDGIAKRGKTKGRMI